MIWLRLGTAKAYDLRVPAKSGAGRDNPIGIGALALLKALFCALPLYGGRRWATARLAGSYSRFVTPTSSATLPVTRERRTPCC